MADAAIAEQQAHKTDLEGRINDFILYGGFTLNALDPSPENKALIQTAYARLPAGTQAATLSTQIPGSGYGVNVVWPARCSTCSWRPKPTARPRTSRCTRCTYQHRSGTRRNGPTKRLHWRKTADREDRQRRTAAGDRPRGDATVHINNGFDANKDGQIGWQEGEGGLAQALTHMNLMMRGEGMPDASPAQT